tara:strand:- start:511 stop:786 length:276 start_codon:yes stop_codon:yes gene_type:complete
MYVVKVSLILLYLFPLTSLADEILGEKLFNRSCATCHKRTAPNIIGTKLEMNTFKMIVMNGRAGTMMGSFSSKFTEKEIENIHTYLSNAKK